MIKQVHFRSWSTGPKGYWRDVNSMARFVASALQHPMPRCNGLGRTSTIHVDQYKEKFGDVRIYCTLADEFHVRNAWLEEHAVPGVVMEGEPPEEFVKKCFLRDARHYRSCYMDMVELVPHLRDALCVAADYTELLGEDEKAIDEKIMPHARRYPGFYLGRYELGDIEELRDILLKIYKSRW